MSPATGEIATFCYCTHHLFDHAPGCEECACPGFVAKASASLLTAELALGPLLRRYDSKGLIKEDTHG